jgi:hypothetical protein
MDGVAVEVARPAASGGAFAAAGTFAEIDDSVASAVEVGGTLDEGATVGATAVE